MIKIRLRRNLLYVLAVYIFSYLRKIIVLLIKNIYGFTVPYVFLYMMNLGQIIGGSTIYIYQIKTWNKKEEVKYFGIELIYNQKHIEPQDKLFKRLLLIFFASYFDIIEFIIADFLVPNISKISPTIDSRLGCISTISSSLICTYALRFKIGKHHKFSLIVLSSCIILTIILELAFMDDNMNIGRFILAHLLVAIYLVNVTFTDCIEIYMADYNYLNPFVIIMIEGIFEISMSSFYSIGKDPFKEMKKQYEKNEPGKFVLLIFFLFLYLLFSAGLNAYKVYCNVIFTPMARSLMDFFLNPFFNIYYFIKENDFQNNYFYFFICEIICLIVDFFSCVYNEYIILFCLGMEYDTKDEITERATKNEMKSTEYILNGDDDNDDNITSDNGTCGNSVKEME